MELKAEEIDVFRRGEGSKSRKHREKRNVLKSKDIEALKEFYKEETSALEK